MTALDIVIMAAGKGTRMKSARPKVLHRLAGRSLLQHVLTTAAALAESPRIIVITGHGAEQVEAAVRAPGLRFVRQQPQLGTGHAVQQAVPELHDAGITLILNGDVPLIEVDTIRGLIAACAGERLALLTVDLADPTGYGRIVRRGDGIVGIVEEKDATPEQRRLREIYTGVMAAPTAPLKRWLAALRNDNKQGEYYLTDIVAMAVADGIGVTSAKAASEIEVLGVNSPLQLAELERRLQRRRADVLMEAGVRLADPARIDIRGELVCGSDVDIDVGCIFEGQVELGDGVQVGAYSLIADARIAPGSVVEPYTRRRGA
ncbi:MAG: NTP transferase domain-containing protein [Proteobacteria bacterium]|nr:NTP transferase domain-containing protein [Pseudomonadota bacterium]